MKYILTIFSILFFNSFCVAESPEDYWQEYENQYRLGSVKNVVEHVQNLSNPTYRDHEERLRRSRAITYFLSTGGKYGFRQTPATDIERSIIENSISFVAGYYSDEILKTDDFFSEKFREYNPNQTPTPTIIAHLNAVQAIATRYTTAEYLAHQFTGFRQFLDKNNINFCKRIGDKEGFNGRQNRGLYNIGDQKYFGKVVKRDLHDQENKKYESFRNLTQKDNELQEILTLPIATFFNEQDCEVLQIMPFRGSKTFNGFSNIIAGKGDTILDIATQERFFAVLTKVGYAFGVLYRNQILVGDDNAGNLRIHEEDDKFSFVDYGSFYIGYDKKRSLNAMYGCFIPCNDHTKSIYFNECSSLLSHVLNRFLSYQRKRDLYNLTTSQNFSLHGAPDFEVNDHEKTFPTLEKLSEIYNQHEKNKFMIDLINSLLPWRSWLQYLFSGFLNSCNDQNCDREIIDVLNAIQGKLNEYKKSPAEWYNVDSRFWTAIFLQQSIEDAISFIEQRKVS